MEDWGRWSVRRALRTWLRIAPDTGGYVSGRVLGGRRKGRLVREERGGAWRRYVLG